MSSLIFKSLEIKGFRVFEHLQIERLGRVNLIVGKNNVGKSSLLEALMVYAHQGSPQNIWQLLESRDEIQRYSTLGPEREIEEALAIKHLFHGRGDIGQQDSTILIGELDSPESQLSIAAGWYRLDSNTNGRSTLYPLDATAEHQIDNLIVGMTIQKGTQKATIHRFAKRAIPHSLFIQASKQKEIDSLFIPVNGITNKDLAHLWENIALTKRENDVLEMLRIVTKEVERVSLIGYGKNKPLPIVKVLGENEPVPLKSLGEGLNRVFGIALALVNAKNGLLLIDEVTNGLHYSVQLGLWQAIFSITNQLNVQVFATSHSNDCIAAFQEAASNALPNKEQSMLIRLENRQGQIVPILFDEARLAIATREEIEVR